MPEKLGNGGHGPQPYIPKGDPRGGQFTSNNEAEGSGIGERKSSSPVDFSKVFSGAKGLDLGSAFSELQDVSEDYFRKDMPRFCSGNHENDAKQLAERFGEIITNDTIDFLNKNIGNEMIIGNPRNKDGSRFYTLVVAMFKTRYGGRSKFTEIGYDEYENITNSSKARREYEATPYRWGAEREFRKWFNGLNDDDYVPVYRCLKQISVSERNETIDGYLDEDSPISFPYGHMGGTAIYTAAYKDIEKSGMDGGYFENGVKMRMLIRNAGKLRMADRDNYRKSSYLRDALSERHSEIVQTFKDKGYKGDSEKLFRSLLNMLGDSGCVNMLYGYDVMNGVGNEIAILNPDVVLMPRVYENKRGR